MRVHLGCDHAGFELKEQIVAHLRGMGHDVVDHGAYEYQPNDDYPPFCLRAALGVVDDAGSLGIVIGGSGNGEQIAANKVKGIRAALAWSVETATLSRQHGDSNVISIGARMHPIDEALTFVDAFLAQPFSGDERHVRRIAMLAAYEHDGVVPPTA